MINDINTLRKDNDLGVPASPNRLTLSNRQNLFKTAQIMVSSQYCVSIELARLIFCLKQMLKNPFHRLDPKAVMLLGCLNRTKIGL